MTKIDNRPLLVRAADTAVHGAELKSSAAAMTFIGLLGAMSTPLVAVVGDDERKPFTLAEYAKPVVKADGSEDKKLRSAQLTAIMVDLFGQTANIIPDAVKAEFNRCFGAALYAYNALPSANLRLVEIDAGKGRKLVHLGGVPAGEVFSLYDDDNKPTKAFSNAFEHFKSEALEDGRKVDDAALRDKVLSRGVVCNGSLNGVYGVTAPTTVQAIAKLKAAAEAAGLIVVKPRASRAGEGESGDKLLEHANALKVALTAFNEVNGESDVTPSRDFETVMDDVAERWAAYRAAHPVMF